MAPLPEAGALGKPSPNCLLATQAQSRMADSRVCAIATSTP